MKTIVCVLPVWLFAICAYCQGESEKNIDLQQLTDELLSTPDEDIDYEELYENVVQNLSSPLDLNSATAEELRSLHILNDLQINNFITYRNENGDLLDVYEMQVVPGLDLPLIQKLLPFVRVIDPKDKFNRSLLSRMFSPGHSYLITRYERAIETKRGFSSSGGSTRAYLGSPDRVYFRFRSSIPGDFSFGITGEKDPGESFVFSPHRHQWGFDFTSWHLQLRNKGKIKNLIAGDFQAQFGQGLTLGGAFGLGKGGESVATIRKSNIGFQPYTSIRESAYQRGMATSIEAMRNIEISFFYSYTFRDASFGNSKDTLVVSALQTSGYHRTLRELSNRKKVAEQNAGLIINLKKRTVDAGFIVNHIQFDTPTRKTPTVYNQFAFSGDKNFNTSFYLDYRLANISFFSEVAHSIPDGWAGIAGALISAHPKLELSVLYRKYDSDYHTFSSNAFSENTQPANERGIYWGWRYTWDRKYSINGYIDLFSFPWLAFRRYVPSDGYEWLLRGNYKPSRTISLFIQFREEQKALNVPGMSTIYQAGKGIRQNISFQCDYGVGDALRLKSRMQYNTYALQESRTEGWALIQDISFSLGAFQLSGRHALFDTEHYNNRHYVYESDAWGSYSLPAYSGVGVRNYVLFEYKINKTISVWVRYARTRMVNSEEIGSGQDVIDGNTRNDVKFQARLKI